MSPLVSVVIPTYKRPLDIKRAIESVLSQTYKNIEIIVVDDNDADSIERIETEKIMANYESNSKIQYIKHSHNKNGSAARNTGWKASKGIYITYLDDDDEIHSEKMEKQVKCLESLDNNWGACYTAYEVIKPNGKRQMSAEKRSGYLYVESLMRTLFMGSGSNLLLRKTLVDKINGYDESFKRNQDIEFLARVLENYKLAYVDESLLTVHYEIRQNSSTFEQNEEYTIHYLKKFKNRIDNLSQRDKHRVITVISLERAKIAIIYFKRYKTGYNILKENNISIKYITKYIFYILKRLTTKKSYGFYM